MSCEKAEGEFSCRCFEMIGIVSGLIKGGSVNDWVVSLEQVGINDVGRVGGKNASLGEMISHLSALGVSVPTGFATTADAYRDFLSTNNLVERIKSKLAELDVEDVNALAAAGSDIRQWIIDAPLQPALEADILAYLSQLQAGNEQLAVAVRSSATAEDLPDASFAGQQETFLNVRGRAQVLKAIKEVFASLFNDRAIAYRVHQGFDHSEVALSASVQIMVSSESAASGVMFTLDTESGFEEVVFITSAYGLGETVVQGAVNPDEFYVFKPSLKQDCPAILRRTLGGKAIKMIYDTDDNDELVKTVDVPAADRMRFSLRDDEVHELAKQALIIEQHYQRPMDIEWAKEGGPANYTLCRRGRRRCKVVPLRRN
ncbi:Phosphoenolpyruvate synthase [gamma proteobacterium IMCC2047]|nr:Phosphoenolpyruvate synthase [gamma proteobacterium IMCC2047]